MVTGRLPSGSRSQNPAYRPPHHCADAVHSSDRIRVRDDAQMPADFDRQITDDELDLGVSILDQAIADIAG